MPEFVLTKELTNDEVGNTIRGKKFSVLDHGFVVLLDWMGDDQAIVDAARTSYGSGTKHTSDTETLLRYLLRHRHTTPFEMCEVKLLVQVPMDCWRQWVRHRTASVNEYSTRYSQAIDEKQRVPQGQWRAQSESNKQGSSGFVEDWPENVKIVPYDGEEDDTFHAVRRFHSEDPDDYDELWVSSAEKLPFDLSPGDYLSVREESAHRFAQKLYQERLDFGVAREVARKDLFLSTYTRAVWKIDLHNLLHFLSLRMDMHAQHEIRQYATTIGQQIVAKLWPITYQAFLDYRLNAMQLTAIEVSVLTGIMSDNPDLPMSVEQFNSRYQPGSWRHKSRCRERDEFIEKMRILGILWYAPT